MKGRAKFVFWMGDNYRTNHMMKRHAIKGAYNEPL